MTHLVPSSEPLPALLAPLTDNARRNNQEGSSGR